MSRFITNLILTLAIVFVVGVFDGTLAQTAEPGNKSQLSVPYNSQPKDDLFDKKITSILKEHKLVGLSVLAFQGDRIVFRGGYGWAELNPQRQVAPDTIFRTASISKMFTATALMQLYENGKFKLDDDIGDYLGYKIRNPKYPDVKITFRQLLTHTSSIVDDSMYDQIIAQIPQLLRELDIKDMLVPGRMYYSPGNYANYAPGSGFSYSNFGVGIQGSLVEAISGKSFDQYCLEHIFKPLNMDASFDPADIKKRNKLGVIYRPNKNFTDYVLTIDDSQEIKRVQRTAPLGSALAASPAGGLRANVLDISKFMMAHLNGGGRILNKDTADMMHGMEWFGSGLYGFYKQKGFGFHITDDLVPGQRLVGHSAEAYGLIGDAYFDPDTKFGMVFLINGGRYTDENPFFSVESDVAKTIYQEFAPKARETRKIRSKINANTMTVNDRKLFLPVPMAQHLSEDGKQEILFVPAITASDALKVKVVLNSSKVLTFTNGSIAATLTVNEPEILVSGQKIPLLASPYQAGSHIMVPLKELAEVLKVNADFKY